MPDGATLLRALGRLHVVALHFPIALVVAAAAVEWLRALFGGGLRQAGRTSFATTAILLGAAAAAIAAWLGWLYADGEAMAAGRLFWHRWLGVAAAVAAIVAALLALVDRPAAPGGGARAIYRVALLAAALLVGLAGHFGGSLVHGSDHLWEVLRPAQAAVDPVDPVEPEPAGSGDPVADRAIAILEARCVSCHGPAKAKGGLRLDGPQALAGAAEPGAAIVPGDPEGSEVIFRVALPADDPDIMPAKGDPLTAAEIAALEAWIAAGASWPSEAAAPAPEPEPVPALEPDPIPEPTLSGDADDIAAALEGLRDRGAIAQPVALDSPWVEVDLARCAPPAGDADLALLSGLERRLVRLVLEGTAVTDAGVARLAAFSALERLDLGSTAVGDAGLAPLAGLPALRSLDLHATRTGDGAIATLAALPALESVYLWDSAVSDDGAARLRAARPALHVSRGESPLGPPPAAITAENVEFDLHLRPMLAVRCYGCHGPDKQEAGLRFDQRASVFERETPILVAGDPDASAIVERVERGADAKGRMPASGDPLSDEDRRVLRAWIAAGAAWPE